MIPEVGNFDKKLGDDLAALDTKTQLVYVTLAEPAMGRFGKRQVWTPKPIGGTPAPSYGYSPINSPIMVGEVNGDGIDDVMVLDYSTVNLFVGLSTKTKFSVYPVPWYHGEGYHELSFPSTYADCQENDIRGMIGTKCSDCNLMGEMELSPVDAYNEGIMLIYVQ